MVYLVAFGCTWGTMEKNKSYPFTTEIRRTELEYISINVLQLINRHTKDICLVFYSVFPKIIGNGLVSFNLYHLFRFWADIILWQSVINFQQFIPEYILGFLLEIPCSNKQRIWFLRGVGGVMTYYVLCYWNRYFFK